MKKLKIFTRALLVFLGIFFTLATLLAFTSAPFWIWYGLGIKKAGIHRPPEYIVLLGGGGMPSQSGLIRSWYTAHTANRFPKAKIIIALPGDTRDSLSALNLMKTELVIRGISPDRILLEDSGTNTRAQALCIYNRKSNIECRILNNDRTQETSFDVRNSTFDIRNSSVLLVTSPEHLYRAVLVFQKVGFSRVDGFPAFERAIESNILFDGRNLGGRTFIPDVGGYISLRYGFWTQLNYEILILREWSALAYYKLKGWI